MSLDTFYTKHYLYQNYFRSHKTPRIHLKINTTSKHVKEKPGWLSRKRGGSRLSFRASNPKYHFHFFSFFKTSIYCLLAQIKYTNSFSRLHLLCLFYYSADVCTTFYSAYMYGRRQERGVGGHVGRYLEQIFILENIKSLQIIPTQYNSRKRQTAQQREITPAAVTVYCGEEASVRKVSDPWEKLC